MRMMFDSLLQRFLARQGPLNEATPPKQYFRQAYLRNWWGGASSKSGQGSEGKFAEQKIAILQEIIANYQVTSLLDIGCGDCYWMREILPLLGRYHGTDVVKWLVKSNAKAYGSATTTFQWIDLSNPDEQKQLKVKQVDLITCLDVFGHLLNHEIDSLLPFILDGVQAKMLLLTNRREPGSTDYLTRAKTRLEGIDLEQHPVFLRRNPKRLKQISGLYPNDFFELYDLT
jgi:hypothetical protein